MPSAKWGIVYEQTEVIAIEEAEDGVYVRTATGTVKARKSVVMAVHHASFKLLPQKNRRRFPSILTLVPLLRLSLIFMSFCLRSIRFTTPNFRLTIIARSHRTGCCLADKVQVAAGHQRRP